MTDSQVKTWIKTNNTSWKFPTFSYEDENGESIETCETLNDAVTSFKEAFTLWLADNLDRFNRVWDALELEYDPISNYDKNSIITETNSGVDTTVVGLKSGSTVGKLRGFNSTDDNITSTSDVTSQSATDTLTHGHKIVTEDETHGNIGVTSTQDMLNQEIELRKRFSVYSWIMQDIIQRLLIL